ncbi:MAG: arylesterase [Polyangiaceae bacterium]
MSLRVLPLLVLILLQGCQSKPAAEAEPTAAASASASAASSGREPAVVFLGDSLTAGLGLSESQALPSLIQQQIDQAGLSYRVINGGRSGDTTAGGLARVDWYLRDTVDLRVLVIGLGSNDAMRGLPLSTVEENLRAIVQRVRAKHPSVPILLWELKTFPNMGADYGDAYTALFRRVAESEKLRLIDFPLADVAGKPELNQPDGIHPTAEGTKQVAARVWQSLEPVL